MSNMTAAMPVSKSDPSVKALLQATFPNYSGRKIRVAVQRYPLDVRSYWSSGYRSYFSAVNMRTLEVLAVPQNGTPFDGGPVAPDGVMVPPGFAIVEHAYNGSGPQTITIHVHPDSMPKWLPEASRG